MVFIVDSAIQVKKDSNKENDSKVIIYDFCSKHILNGKRFTLKYFLQMGIPRQNIYDIINRVDNEKLLELYNENGKNDKNKTKTTGRNRSDWKNWTNFKKFWYKI